MTTLIPYILAIMILYDFSLHLYDLLINLKPTSKKHPFGMYLVLDYFAGKDTGKRKKAYNLIWTAYWGLASILIISYIMYR